MFCYLSLSGIICFASSIWEPYTLCKPPGWNVLIRCGRDWEASLNRNLWMYCIKICVDLAQYFIKKRDKILLQKEWGCSYTIVTNLTHKLYWFFFAFHSKIHSHFSDLKKLSPKHSKAVYRNVMSTNIKCTLSVSKKNMLEWYIL